jgi:hypothetical protein
MTIWYILCSFGAFCPVLVSCIKKNLATLVRNAISFNDISLNVKDCLLDGLSAKFLQIDFSDLPQFLGRRFSFFVEKPDSENPK